MTPDTSALFWYDQPIDTLTREQRGDLRAHIVDLRERAKRGDTAALSIPPWVISRALYRLKQLDYFDDTQFSLLGAADDRVTMTKCKTCGRG